MIKYYNQFVDNDTNITYSIDSVVVDMVFKYSNSGIYAQSFFDSLSTNYSVDIKHWFSTKFLDFKDNFSITLDEGVSFYVGVGFNGVEHWHKNYCRVDFNPNKVRRYKAFVDIFNQLMTYCKPPTIKRYDLAIDIPIKRENCFMAKGSKQYRCIENSASDKTEYLGKGSNVGAVKLYNKQRESDLSMPMTRLEVTLGVDLTYDDVLEHIPKLTIIDDLQLAFDPVDKVTPTDRVLIELLLCSNRYDLLKGLDFKKRKKIERILERYVQAIDLPKTIYSNIITELNTYSKALDVRHKEYSDVFKPIGISREFNLDNF